MDALTFFGTLAGLAILLFFGWLLGMAFRYDPPRDDRCEYCKGPKHVDDLKAFRCKVDYHARVRDGTPILH